MTKPAHYRGDYHVRAARVREAANRDPTTRCWRCGHPATPGDPWEAGHTRDSDPTAPLAAEHRSCNRRAAAERTNAQRAAAPIATARQPAHTSATW